MGFRKFAGALMVCTGIGGFLAVAPASAIPVKLITNGGFEDVTTFTPDGGSGSVQFVGDRSSTRTSNNGVNVPLAGWTTYTGCCGQYDRGIILFTNGYAANTPGSGTYAIQLEGPDDYIQQHVATVAGRQYRLSYDLSAYGETTFGFNGQVDFFFNNFADRVISPTVNGATWHQQSFDFTATTAGTDLRIRSLGQYPQLDNISLSDVTPQDVPEPGSLALLGLAFTGVSMVSRRRRA